MVRKGVLSLFFLMNLHSSHCRYGMYEQETILKRNPYTGATTVVRENEFIPMANAGVMGPTFGGGFGPHIGRHHHHFI
jgi:hypothetical protein